MMRIDQHGDHGDHASKEDIRLFTKLGTDFV